MTFPRLFVSRALFKKSRPFHTPLLEQPRETLLVRVTKHLGDREQLLGGFKFRGLGQVTLNDLYLVELAHLHLVLAKHLKHPAKPVANDTLYLEVVQKKPVKAFLVIREGFLTVYELTPQHLARETVFHYHHPELLAPVGGIHQDNNVLVAGNNPCRTF